MKLPATVFYSWQKDLPGKTNRNLIQDALEAAAQQLRKEGSVYAAPEITRDTEGVPGSPEIHSAIFEKISGSVAAVFDVSLVTPAVEGKKQHPNSNVLVELGFALAKLGDSRVVLVLNRAFGPPEGLPFDLRNKRGLVYSMKPDDEPAKARATLKAQLVQALDGITRHERNRRLTRAVAVFSTLILTVGAGAFWKDRLFASPNPVVAFHSHAGNSGKVGRRCSAGDYWSNTIPMDVAVLNRGAREAQSFNATLVFPPDVVVSNVKAPPASYGWTQVPAAIGYTAFSAQGKGTPLSRESSTFVGAAQLRVRCGIERSVVATFDIEGDFAPRCGFIYYNAANDEFMSEAFARGPECSGPWRDAVREWDSADSRADRASAILRLFGSVDGGAAERTLSGGEHGGESVSWLPSELELGLSVMRLSDGCRYREVLGADGKLTGQAVFMGAPVANRP